MVSGPLLLQPFLPGGVPRVPRAPALPENCREPSGRPGQMFPVKGPDQGPQRQRQGSHAAWVLEGLQPPALRQRELPREGDTHSLKLSASFRKLPSWPLAFSSVAPRLRFHSNRLPILGSLSRACPPLLSTAPPAPTPRVSSVWVGTGIRVCPGQRCFSQGRCASVISLRQLGPCPEPFKCPRLNDWPWVSSSSLSRPPIKLEN